MTTKLTTSRSRGFTIVELLIVIVVIAILAAISVVAYNGIQERARVNAAAAELNDLRKAIYLARISRNQPLISITGSNHTSQDAGCLGSTYPGSLAKTHTCWTVTTAALQSIATAANVSLNGVIDGDPWGAPYYLDENEADNWNSQGMCRKDILGAYTNPMPATLDSSYALANGGSTGYNWVRSPVILPSYASNCPA